MAIQITAPIVHVTVFRERAQITRRGALTIPQGEHTLILENLPLSIEENSVRVTGQGDGVTLLGADLATVVVTTPPPQIDKAALQSQLDTIEDERLTLADEEVVLKTKIDVLQVLGRATASSMGAVIVNQQGQAEQIESIMAYVEREIGVIHVRHREIVTKQRALERTMTALQSEQRAASAPATSTKQRVIRVHLQASQDTDLQLEILYLVKDASWSPRYELRVQNEGIQLTYLASIRQKSGEDWPSLPLILSTARLEEVSTLPSLATWFIDEQDSRVLKESVQRKFDAWLGKNPTTTRPLGSGAESITLKGIPRIEDLEAEAQAETIELATMQVEGTGYVLEYRILQAIAVPSDDTPHKTAVAVLDLPAELDYVTIPKMSEQVIWRAKVRNVSPFTLLEGSVDVFEGTNLIGRTAIKNTAPHEELAIPLTFEPRIKVRRRLVERVSGTQDAKKWMFYRYIITLTNYSPTLVAVTLRDQLPVGLHQNIKIELREALPAPEEHTALNILKWRVEIPPQETREVDFAFAVESPKAMELSGIL